MTTRHQSKDAHSFQRTPARSLFRAETARILDLYEAADQRAKHATTIEDREAAEEERRRTEGEFYAAGRELAELFIQMLRLAHQHNPDAVRDLLTEVLQPELLPLAEAITQLEARK